jgi:hypothetical protein
MATPKEKAKELILKFMHNVLDYTQTGLDTFKAKQCALIAVDEILEALLDYDANTEESLKKEFPNYFSCEIQNMESDLNYWSKVKQEIEKL